MHAIKFTLLFALLLGGILKFAVAQSPGIPWDRTLGGEANDYMVSGFAIYEGDFLVYGNSYSNNSPDKSEVSRGKSEDSKGEDDFWVVKLNSSGTQEKDKTIGGTKAEYLQSLIPSSDGNFLLVGPSNSGDTGEKTEANRGDDDYWIVNLEPGFEPVILSVAVEKDAVEDNENGSFTLSLSQALSEPLTVNFTLSGTAKEGEDYTSPGSSVEIPAGTESLSIPIAVLADELIEVEETLIIKLTGVSSDVVQLAASPQDEAELKIASEDKGTVRTTVVQDASEETAEAGAFELSLSKASSTDITITFSLSGTATAEDDYKAVTGKAVIAAGELSTRITIEAIDDSAPEEDETVVLNLIETDHSDVAVENVEEDQRMIISDNDPAYLLSVRKGEDAAEDNQNGNFIFELSNTFNTDIAVEFSLSGTATEGLDYKELGGSVRIPANKSNHTLSVEVLADQAIEGEESIELSITGLTTDEAIELDPAASKAAIALHDNDMATLSVAVEKDAAEDYQNGSFIISSTVALPADVKVLFSLSGTATAGEDYTSPGGEVVLPAGQTSVTVPVAVMEDQLMEGNETVILTLEKIESVISTNEVILDGTASLATLKIIDNDVAILSVVVEKDAAEDDQDGNFRISSTLVLPIDITIQYSVSGTAEPEQDYSSLEGNKVVLPAWQTSVSVPIWVKPDQIPEGEETVVLTLSPREDEILLDEKASSAKLRIMDNEACFTLTHMILEASCQDATDGKIDITVGGASEEMAFTWSNGFKGEDLVNVAPGNYQLEVVDKKTGCIVNREFKVPVKDQVLPLVQVHNLTLQLDENGQATLTAEEVDNGSSDNCGIGGLTINQTSFSCSDIGENQLVLTVEDVNGNTASAVAVVRVEDQKPPVVAPDQEFIVQKKALINTTIGTIEASDNCKILEWQIKEGNEENLFKINESGQLLTGASLEAAKKEYSLLIQVSDGFSLSSQKMRVIVKESPPPMVGIALENQQVLEDEAFSFTVPVEAFVYENPEELVYNILGKPDWLEFDASTRQYSGTPLNEDVGVYQLTVRASDGQGRYAEQPFSLEVINTNDAPEGLILSASQIKENQPEGSLVGNLSVEDVDVGDVHTYSLVSGEGDGFNHSFRIEGSKLVTAQVLDYELENQLSIRLAVTDEAGAFYEQIFVLEVIDEEDSIEEEVTPFLPNLFSPNGDQINDYFILRASHVEQIHLRIFNRQGRLVYETKDLQEATQNGWDGRSSGEAQPEGTYVWILEGSSQNGTPLSVNGKISGSVTLIR